MNMAADKKLPRDKLMENKPLIRFAKHSFDKTLKLDKENEKLPKKWLRLTAENISSLTPAK